MSSNRRTEGGDNALAQHMPSCAPGGSSEIPHLVQAPIMPGGDDHLSAVCFFDRRSPCTKEKGDRIWASCVHGVIHTLKTLLWCDAYNV